MFSHEKYIKMERAYSKSAAMNILHEYWNIRTVISGNWQQQSQALSALSHSFVR